MFFSSKTFLKKFVSISLQENHPQPNCQETEWRESKLTNWSWFSPYRKEENKITKESQWAFKETYNKKQN